MVTFHRFTETQRPPTQNMGGRDTPKPPGLTPMLTGIVLLLSEIDRPNIVPAQVAFTFRHKRMAL